jgi:Methylamine utilisation protein MauE
MSGTLWIDPCVGYLLVTAYAVFFGWAAYLKGSNIRAFTAMLGHYRLLPKVMTPIAALVVLLCEAIIAVLLLLPSTRSLAAIMGAGLCLLYSVAIGINLQRGRRDLDCGCLGPLKRRPISGWMVWRNLALAATLLIICLPWSSRALDGVDLLTIAAGALALALLYATVDSLMANSLRAQPVRTTP